MRSHLLVKTRVVGETKRRLLLCWREGGSLAYVVTERLGLTGVVSTQTENCIALRRLTRSCLRVFGRYAVARASGGGVEGFDSKFNFTRPRRGFYRRFEPVTTIIHISNLHRYTVQLLRTALLSRLYGSLTNTLITRRRYRSTSFKPFLVSSRS